MHLEVGDIILSHEREGTFSKIITLTTGYYYSHCAIYIGNGMLLESVRQGVRVFPLKKELKVSDYIIFRCGLNDEQKQKLLRLVDEYLDYTYDYGTTISMFKNILKVGKQRYAKKDRAIVCSNLVDECYKKIGINLCNKQNPLPRDIANSPYLYRVY